MIFHRLWKEHFLTLRNIGSFFAKTKHFSTESKAPDGSASDSAQYPKNIWPNDNQRCKKKTSTLPKINCQIEISTNCVLFWTDNFHNIKTEFSNSKCSLNMVCGWSVFVSCLLPVVLQINWKWFGSLSLWGIDGFWHIFHTNRSTVGSVECEERSGKTSEFHRFVNFFANTIIKTDGNHSAYSSSSAIASKSACISSTEEDAVRNRPATWYAVCLVSEERDQRKDRTPKQKDKPKGKKIRKTTNRTKKWSQKG